VFYSLLFSQLYIFSYLLTSSFFALFDIHLILLYICYVLIPFIHLYHFVYTDATDPCLLKATWLDLQTVQAKQMMPQWDKRYGCKNIKLQLDATNVLVYVILYLTYTELLLGWLCRDRVIKSCNCINYVEKKQWLHTWHSVNFMVIITISMIIYYCWY